MINYPVICRTLGSLLFLLALLLLSCLGIGTVYGEDTPLTFGLPAAISFLLGLLLKTLGMNAPNGMSRRDGFLVVSLTWVTYTSIGMLPFLVGGHETRIAAAFFEAMSGFTTTGATIFNDIDSLPRSILFWRSLMHWLGGMGIVFFTIAVLPAMGSGKLCLFSAESTGLKLDKLHPRISTTARWLWGVYILLTVSCTLSLYLAGMSLFDAVNHAFSTVATGGFSTHQDGLAHYASPLIDYIEIFFMFISGINFTLLYLLLIKGRFKEVLRDSELRCFFVICATAIAIITAVVYFSTHCSFEQALRMSAFHVVALQTTTGLASADFMQWPHAVWIVLLLVTAIGSCAGSTSGGIKCVRVLTAYKVAATEFKRILHPRAVVPIHINHTAISGNIVRTIFAFFAAYAMIVFADAMLMTALGLPLLDAFGIAVTSLSNVGPSIGYQIGPLDSWSALPDLALWTNAFVMLTGRLEIFSLLLPFMPDFWKDN